MGKLREGQAEREAEGGGAREGAALRKGAGKVE